jgi:hypothetical protein
LASRVLQSAQGAQQLNDAQQRQQQRKQGDDD